MSIVDTTHFGVDYFDGSGETDEHVSISHVDIDPDEFVENPAFAQYVDQFTSHSRNQLLAILNNSSNEDQQNAAKYCLWQLKGLHSAHQISSDEHVDDEVEEVEDGEIDELDANEYDPPLSLEELESMRSIRRKPR